MGKFKDRINKIIEFCKTKMINKKEGEIKDKPSSFDEKTKHKKAIKEEKSKKWESEEKQKKAIIKKQEKLEKKEKRKFEKSKKETKISDIIIYQDGIAVKTKDSIKNPKNKDKPYKTFKTAIKIFITIFFGALIGISGFLAYAFLVNPLAIFEAEGFSRSDPSAIRRYSDNINTKNPVKINELDMLKSVADKEMMEGTINVAIIGVDYEPIRETSEWKTKDKQFFADVMLVLAINFKENTVDMVNIPRDSYWGIYETPGYYKLNMSFYAGGELEGAGFFYTAKSMEGVLGGIPIDYYIGVTMPVVKEIVDVLGGVDFEIEKKMVMGDRVLNQGMQHLDGQQALDYLRVRQKRNPGMGNDISRVDRQKEFLIALFSQAKDSKKLLSIPKIIGAMEGRVYTNMTYQQLSALVIFGTGVDTEKIGMYTFKGSYDYTMANHHLYILYEDSRVELIKEIYGIEVEKSDVYNKTKFRKDALIIKAGKLAYYAQKRANEGGYGASGTQVLRASSSLKSAIKDGNSSSIESRYNSLVRLVGDNIELYFSDFNKDGLPYNG
jgi:polyisoprenyl-teichoic acid--peptidoglycan teichoic acid transferase